MQEARDALEHMGFSPQGLGEEFKGEKLRRTRRKSLKDVRPEEPVPGALREPRPKPVPAPPTELQASAGLVLHMGGSKPVAKHCDPRWPQEYAHQEVTSQGGSSRGDWRFRWGGSVEFDSESEQDRDGFIRDFLLGFLQERLGFTSNSGVCLLYTSDAA